MCDVYDFYCQARDTLRLRLDRSKYSDRIVLEIKNPSTYQFEEISEVEIDYEPKREPNDY